uniref:Uncharacterized protein n=1 Tax=Arundo donax TaxID=35708 RepID=A0A0A8Y5X9_ARUDO
MFRGPFYWTLQVIILYHFVVYCGKLVVRIILGIL